MDIHGGIAKESKGGFINGLCEHISDHVVCADEERSEDKEEHSALEHLGTAFVVTRASGCAVLLDGSDERLIVAKHRRWSGDGALVVDEQVASENGSFGGLGGDSVLSLVRRNRNNFDARCAPIDSTVVIHNDVAAHRARVGAPRAVVGAVESAGLKEVRRVGIETEGDAETAAVGDADIFGGDEVSNHIEAELVVLVGRLLREGA